MPSAKTNVVNTYCICLPYTSYIKFKFMNNLLIFIGFMGHVLFPIIPLVFVIMK